MLSTIQIAAAIYQLLSKLKSIHICDVQWTHLYLEACYRLCRCIQELHAQAYSFAAKLQQCEHDKCAQLESLKVQLEATIASNKENYQYELSQVSCNKMPTNVWIKTFRLELGDDIIHTITTTICEGQQFLWLS